MGILDRMKGSNKGHNRQTSSSSFPDSQYADSSTPPRGDDEPGGLNSSSYAHKRRTLMKLHRDLRALGVQTIIPLPRIAVIGGQSAGKSSLVEAVSGINVPRDSGTCTRCPTECTMLSGSKSWSCQISVRIDHDSHGKQLHNPRTTTFGPILTDKSMVEIWMRRAQAAILSPHLSPDSFYTRSVDEIRNLSSTDLQVLKFSHNTVCVDINDPDATDLSFVDLPGLIQNETQEIVNLVKDLAVSHIEDESTLILVTIPMSDDMENQAAVRLAREADPKGERTIGVLTKPDMLTDGATSARQRWRNVLEGNEHQQEHGYFCVRLSDDEERKRNISPAEADRKAQQFFNSNAPWNEVRLQHPKRFGIPGFVSYISVLLTNLIEQCIPELKQEVKRLLLENAAERARLPAAISFDPMTEVLERINKFSTELTELVHARGRDKSLIHRNKAAYMIFKDSIRATAPDFRPLEGSVYVGPEEVLGWKISQDDPVINSPAESIKSDFYDQVEEVVDVRKQYGVYDVRKIIKRETGWELPHYIPFDATKFLIDEFIQQWQKPALVCFESVSDILAGFVDQAISTHFGRFPSLEDTIQAVMAEVYDSQKEQARKALLATLCLEDGPFVTQNSHYYENTRSKWLETYRRMRRHHDTYTVSNYRTKLSDHGVYLTSAFSREEEALKALKRLGYNKISMDDLERLHPPDEFDEELTVMADVRAYFQVAYKRVIDHIPLSLDHSLNQGLCNNLQYHLWRKLDLSGDQAATRLEALLSEDPAIAKHRSELEEMHTRLADMQQRLNQFTT